MNKRPAGRGGWGVGDLVNMYGMCTARNGRMQSRLYLHFPTVFRPVVRPRILVTFIL